MPSRSDIGADVVKRFVDQLGDAVTRLEKLDEPRAARTVAASPFIKVITYSVLDAWRLVFAHGRRHVEQARRVMASPDFRGDAPLARSAIV